VKALEATNEPGATCAPSAPVRAPETALTIERRRELQRRACLRERGGLYNFVRLAWAHVEPAPFVGGWHIEMICAHLEAVARGEIKQLIINVPPGFSKSLTVSVLFPIWVWLTRATRKFMFATFDDSLANRDSERSRNLLVSQWFRELFGDLCGHDPSTCAHPRVIHSRHDQGPNRAERSDTQTVWYNAAGGLRFSTTPESKATGWHANIQVVDDPTKPQAVLGGATDARNALERVGMWFSGTMATRRAEPVSDFTRIIVMQRLHDDDLAGRLLKVGGWVHVNLPMEFVPETRCATPWGVDPRTERGELLCPARFPGHVVAQLKVDMGPLLYSAQCQQNPVPPTGGVIDPTWIQYTELTIQELVQAGATAVLSLDATFEANPNSDRVSLQLWFWLPSTDSFYLMWAQFDQLSFTKTIELVRKASFDFDFVGDKLVEKKANGPAIVNTLEQEISGFVLCNPLGSKNARCVATTPAFAAKRVLVKADQDWTSQVVEEWCRFPRHKFDDNVDSMTQAIGYFMRNDVSWVRYMGQLFTYLQGGASKQ